MDIITKSLRISRELEVLISDYQRENFIGTWSGAAIELIRRGLDGVGRVAVRGNGDIEKARECGDRRFIQEGG